MVQKYKNALVIAIGCNSHQQHALKGQKLLAQGNTLGIMANSNAPCKGNSFLYCQEILSFCPYRATGYRIK